MVKTMCSWRDTLAVWPALVVGGGSFAGFQYLFATFHRWVPGWSVWPFTDIGGGLFSLVLLAGFLRWVWRPRRTSGGSPLKCGMRISECGMRAKSRPTRQTHMVLAFIPHSEIRIPH